MIRKKRTVDGIENAIPGFGFSAPGEQVAAEPKDPDPARTFTETGAELRTLLSGRDPVAFLARTGLHLFLQSAKDPASDSVEGLQQPSAELLQTIALMLPRGPDVPTSPRNMVRAWELAERNIHAYAGSTIPAGSDLSASERVSRQARIQTLFYRNIFSSDDAQEIVPALLAYMDQASLSRLGYRLSDVARALFRFLQLVPDKLDSFRSVPAGFHTGQVDDTELERLVGSSTLLPPSLALCKSQPDGPAIPGMGRLPAKRTRVGAGFHLLARGTRNAVWQRRNRRAVPGVDRLQ